MTIIPPSTDASAASVASQPASQVECCRFSEMDLGLGGEDLGMAEWLHFMLLRATPAEQRKENRLSRLVFAFFAVCPAVCVCDFLFPRPS